MPTRSDLRPAALLLAALLLCAPALLAQNSVRVVTQINPPYSPYLSDYVSYQNKIVLTLQNLTAAPQNVRLVGEITGANGIAIRIPQEFVPATPIALAPSQLRTLMGAQIRDYLNPDNLQFTGISKNEVVRGNGLPEGSYTICLRAVDYSTGQPLSQPAPAGCFTFQIAQYETPMLSQPACNSTVTPAQPQSLLLTWTPPAGVQPSAIEYVLTVVEMHPQSIDATQALNAATDPPFFTATVKSPSFLYGPSAPKLEIGRKYAWRVRVKSAPGQPALPFRNNGLSVGCWFQYGLVKQGGGIQAQAGLADKGGDKQIQQQGGGQQQQQQQQQGYGGDCAVLSCAPQPLAQGPAAGTVYKVGDQVQIGRFTMRLTSLSATSASALSGEGEVDAPIFRVKLKTTFQNLQVNAQHAVFSGKAIGAYDPGAQVDQALKSVAGNLQNVAVEKVKQVADYVKAGQKYIENFANLDVKGLPFGWKKLVNSNIQLVNIVAVEFAPDGARLNAVMEFPIPEANNKILAFGTKNICFHPTGLSVDGLQKLTMLGSDVTIPWGAQADMVLKAAAPNNGGTWVKWDCEGFQGLQVDGELVFKNTANGLLVKSQGQGPVTAKFTLQADAWGDFVGTVALDPFEIRGLQGLRVSFTTVTFDYSDTENPQGISFPQGYQGDKTAAWKGLHIEQATITFPDYLKRNGQPVTVTMNDALITKLGFSGLLSAVPVFGNIDQGNLGGWGFTMDSLRIQILNNSLQQGRFSGKLQLPVSEKTLGYSCLLATSQQGAAFQFGVKTLDDLELNLWAATLELEAGSGVTVSAQGGSVTVVADLSGSLTINTVFQGFKNLAVNIPDMHFQHFTVSNKAPYLGVEYFSMASPQKKFAGFHVSIDPGVGGKFLYDNPNNPTKVGLDLAFEVGLDGNGSSAISGGTTFTVWGERVDQGGKQRWKLGTPSLKEIWVDAELAALSIKGTINLFNGDAVYGNGFRGKIEAVFKPKMKITAMVQFGSVDDYRYWYVDALVKLPAPIPVSAGFGFWGFGGGAYFNMEREKSLPAHAAIEDAKADPGTLDQETAGKTYSGVSYKPKKPQGSNLLGLKATLLMGTIPTPMMFNGDITIEASFFLGGGLNYLGISGNGYFVSVPNAKERSGSPMLYAGVDFSFWPKLKEFEGILTIGVAIPPPGGALLKGGGQAQIYFGPGEEGEGKWYVKFGTPQSPFSFTFLKMFTTQFYFMAGKNSLPGAPPLPYPELEAEFTKPVRDDEADNGTGFAFGQRVTWDTGERTFLIFYLKFLLDFGFDLFVMYDPVLCSNADGVRGFNGWYADGQAFAYVEGSVGLQIKLWFFKGKLELFGVKAAAALKARLPNPTWAAGVVKGSYSVLNGLISGSMTLKFETGEECKEIVKDPFGGLKVIADMMPMDGKSGIDPSTYPEVAFNFPVGHGNTPGDIITVTALNDEGKVVEQRFRFGLDLLELDEQQANESWTELPGTVSMHNNRKTALLNLTTMLEGNTWHRLRCRVYGMIPVKQGKTETWEKIKKENSNQIHYEERSISFRTGAAPNRFLDNAITETYPRRMQRYYHKGEISAGIIRFKPNAYPAHIPEEKPKNDAYIYRFVARFIEVGAGAKQIFETPLNFYQATHSVRFDIPNAMLQREKIYIVQFVRRTEKNPQKWLQADPSTLGSVQKQQSYGGTVLAWREARLTAGRVGQGEFLLYQIAFKTSRYDRFEDKLADYLSSTPTLKWGSKSAIRATYTGKEALDWYDVNPTSYSKGSVTFFVDPPLVATAEKGSGSWFTDYFSKYEMKVLGAKYYLSTVKGNPSSYVRRTYPHPNYMPPASRWMSEHTAVDMIFPKYTAVVRYTGNGYDDRLTQDEISAVYWKGLNQGGGGQKKILAMPKQGGGGAGMAQQGLGIAANFSHTMEITSDLITTVWEDMQRLNYACVMDSYHDKTEYALAKDAFLALMFATDPDNEKDPRFFNPAARQGQNYPVKLSYSYPDHWYSHPKTKTVQLRRP